MQQWIIALVIIFSIGCASSASKDKSLADLHLRLAAAQIESGDYPYALQELLKAEKLDPENAAIQSNLGLVYFHRDRLDLAERHLRKAVALQPQFADARNNLSRVLLEAGKYEEAEKQIKIVVNDLTYPYPEKALANYGLIRFNQKDYVGAKNAFASILRSQPEDCIANTYFGRCLFEQKSYESAAESLDKAISFCQKNLYDEPHYYSALTYYRLGNKSKSITRFEELIKFYPNGIYRDKAKGMLSILRKGQ